MFDAFFLLASSANISAECRNIVGFGQVQNSYELPNQPLKIVSESPLN